MSYDDKWMLNDRSPNYDRLSDWHVRRKFYIEIVCLKQRTSAHKNLKSIIEGELELLKIWGGDDMLTTEERKNSSCTQKVIETLEGQD